MTVHSLVTAASFNRVTRAGRCAERTQNTN
nr:MAG TPA: hypothetical protein [Caudoviricetes sp.]DAJ00764.1 MAG TPA: hypothetical protein [Caudoviricetes sp.]DAL96725.1 MAG TPA: hypothetical protein [Caudoviricetes sp.]